MMSTLDVRDPIKSHMLRSATPGSNEKVLLYLEGMSKYPPDDDKASSIRSSVSRLRSPLSNGASRLDELPEEGDNGDGGDIRSDVQEGNGSDIMRTIPVHTTGPPEHEPGPNDPPGPHFESYGSSFGNFGPLPAEGAFAPPLNGTAWNAQNAPTKNGMPLPALSSDSHPNPFQQFGMTPVVATGIPLPATMASAAEIPSSPAMSRSRMNGSRASNKSPPPADFNAMMSPKSTSRVLSPQRTANGEDRPLSPRTAGSQNQSSRSRNPRMNPAAYPLPDSEAQTPRPPSPVERQTNKSPSIAPSDSPSQARSRRSMRSPANDPSQPVRPVRTGTDVNGGGAYARSQGPMSPRTNASQPLSPPRDDTQRAAASAMSPTRSRRSDPQATPTPSRPVSPMDDLNAEEQRMVNNLLTRPPSPRSRTSYAPSTMAPSMLEPEVQNSHFHDMELCQLLHALDQPLGEPVKKAVRKAVRARVKKLGMKYDNESIRQYRKSYHDHDPSVHLSTALQPTTTGSRRSTQLGTSQEPPEWAKDLIDGMINMRERLDSLAPKIERSLRSSRVDSYAGDGQTYPGSHHHHYSGAYTHSSMAPSANIHMHPTGDESMYQPGDTDILRDSTHLQMHHDGSLHGASREDDLYDDEEEDINGHQLAPTDGDTQYMPRGESPGQQYLEEELYKLRVKPSGSQSVATHKTWEVARDDGEEYDDGDAQAAVTESGMPEIPDGATGFTDRRGSGSPPLPPLPQDGRGDLVNMPEAQVWQPGGYEQQLPPPWQRIHQRLLSWAIVWPMAELDNAVNSTMRGMQVDEIALSIWSTQTYKRYVRAKMTDSPPGRVDRLFVPPNMADAISTAVYNGRHGDACGMLRDLWAPFGLEGIPRLLIVLAKHRNDDHHWVVHRFSLPDGSLTTYDTYPERCLPDGRPLGWWFAIRIAWPDAVYPSPDHLMQKMVRLHRPMQLAIDNSVAAAGIWRNLLMGSRAERSLDLERLRDLINTEVKNLRQRKQMGKLSIGSPRPNWEDMH